jgi:putative hydrolase of the HAD superfamily
MAAKYSTLFLDVGNVLLTNGWDHHMRDRAAKLFGLDEAEMNARHALTFDTYEIGKITLEEYIQRVVFYQPRNFSLEVFKTYMLEQSQPIQPMLELMRELKKRHKLKMIAVSNEGRELMIHRIQKFNLKDFIDSFICSCFVHLRKPDMEIYDIALDISQANPDEVIYIDDRKMLIEILEKKGIRGIYHTNYEQTKTVLEGLLK